MRTWRAFLLGVLALTLPLFGCSHPAGETSAATGTSNAQAGQKSTDPLAALVLGTWKIDFDHTDKRLVAPNGSDTAAKAARITISSDGTYTEFGGKLSRKGTWKIKNGMLIRFISGKPLADAWIIAKDGATMYETLTFKNTTYK